MPDPKNEEPSYTIGSANVFADLGLPRADEALAKAEIARQVSALIRARGMTQAETADLLGIDQPKISALVRGRLSGFSMDRLLRFVNQLGSDVDIVIRASTDHDRTGRVRVLEETNKHILVTG